MALFKKNVTVTKSLAMNGKDTGAIVGVKGMLLGRIVRMEAGKEIIIGSDPSVAELVIDNENVKNKHCSIKYVQGDKTYIVENLSDGELVADGEDDLAQGETYVLQPGTRIYIGSPSNEIRLG